MYRLIKTLVIFILPIVFIAYPLDLIISNLWKNYHKYPGEIEVWEDIYEGNINCDIAIYGGSNAWVHINPEILTENTGLSAYNFGIDGHNFWLQHCRHIEYLKYNPKPKTIIIAIAATGLAKKEELYQQNQFLPYMLWNNTIMKYTSSYIGYDITDYYLPLFRYFGKKKVFLTISHMLYHGISKVKYRKNGYRGMDRQWNTDIDKANKRRKSFEIKQDSSLINFFEQFIIECQQSNIELILVNTPMYTEGQRIIENRKDIVNMYSNFANKYHLLFLDYSTNKICHNKNLFYNNNHLTKEGADVFSRILVDDIKHILHNTM